MTTECLCNQAQNLISDKKEVGGGGSRKNVQLRDRAALQ